jgi:hypothetical protein
VEKPQLISQYLTIFLSRILEFRMEWPDLDGIWVQTDLVWLKTLVDSICKADIDLPVFDYISL